jgi:acylphosphatase
MPNARASIVIKGEVQGVGFRFFVRAKAQALGLKGWVRNNDDNSVEVCAEGERMLIEKLIEFCRKGPSMAKVEDVEVKWEKPLDEFGYFYVED